MPITATFDINVSGRSVVMTLLGHGADITLRPCATRADAERVAEQIRKQLQPYEDRTPANTIEPLDACRVQLLATLVDDPDFQEFVQMNNITHVRAENTGGAMEFIFSGTYDALRDMIKDWFNDGDPECLCSMMDCIEKI